MRKCGACLHALTHAMCARVCRPTHVSCASQQVYAGTTHLAACKHVRIPHMCQKTSTCAARLLAGMHALPTCWWMRSTHTHAHTHTCQQTALGMVKVDSRQLFAPVCVGEAVAELPGGHMPHADGPALVACHRLPCTCHITCHVTCHAHATR